MLGSLNIQRLFESPCGWGRVFMLLHCSLPCTFYFQSLSFLMPRLQSNQRSPIAMIFWRILKLLNSMLPSFSSQAPSSQMISKEQLFWSVRLSSLFTHLTHLPTSTHAPVFFSLNILYRLTAPKFIFLPQIFPYLTWYPIAFMMSRVG